MTAYASDMGSSEQNGLGEGGYRHQYDMWHGDEEFEGRVAYHVEQIRGLLPPGARTGLDIGCGGGAALSALRRLGLEAEGLESDEGQVAQCQARGHDVSLTDDSNDWLGTRRHKFDVVLLLDVLEHLPLVQAPALLQAARDAVRPGGRVVLTVPNAGSAAGFLYFALDPTHHRCFTEQSLTALLTSCGFQRPIFFGERGRDVRLSRRFWRAGWREAFKRYALRRIWLATVGVELPMMMRSDDLLLEPNLTCCCEPAAASAPPAGADGPLPPTTC